MTPATVFKSFFVFSRMAKHLIVVTTLKTKLTTLTQGVDYNKE